MTDINQLIDELQDLVDDKRERVAKLFADIRASVPRPMTLVFAYDEKYDSFVCDTPVGRYRYFKGVTCALAGAVNHDHFEATAELEMRVKMQFHFDAAWSAMTAKGAAHGT